MDNLALDGTPREMLARDPAVTRGLLMLHRSSASGVLSASRR